jgi:hypothetical protein
MTTESEVRQAPWWSSFWLGGLGTLLMMSFGFVLKRWLPLHFAMGIGGFVGWFAAGLIFARRTPPKYGIPVGIAALIMGIATGLCAGLLSYYFPW